MLPPIRAGWTPGRRGIARQGAGWLDGRSYMEVCAQGCNDLLCASVPRGTTFQLERSSHGTANCRWRNTMPILLWLLGIPIPLILLFILFAR
jgi:hypothetical protein